MIIPRLRHLLCLILSLILVASANSAVYAMDTRLTDHAFSFDAMRDSPDALILDYRYGQIKPQPYEYREGLGVRQSMNYNGNFLRGEALYVKWRIKSTGHEHEDSVDLKNRLPLDITRHRIHFAIQGQQLYVYLISPEKRPESWPVGPLKKYSDLKVFTVYPD